MTIVRHTGKLSAWKIHTLLTGEDVAPIDKSDGYFGDREAMKQDWAEWREQLTSVWRSGEYTCTEIFAKHGLEVKGRPWLFACGSAKTLPWAARQFDRGVG